MEWMAHTIILFDKKASNCVLYVGMYIRMITAKIRAKVRAVMSLCLYGSSTVSHSKTKFDTTGLTSIHTNDISKHCVRNKVCLFKRPDEFSNSD